MLKKSLTTLVLLLGLLCQTQAFAYNPHHRLTIALENGVRALPGGEQLIDRARAEGLEYLLFHCFVVNDQNRSLCAEEYIIDREAQTVFFHGDYHGADFDDLVLIVEEALRSYLN